MLPAGWGCCPPENFGDIPRSVSAGQGRSGQFAGDRQLGILHRRSGWDPTSLDDKWTAWGADSRLVPEPCVTDPDFVSPADCLESEWSDGGQLH